MLAYVHLPGLLQSCAPPAAALSCRKHEERWTAQHHSPTGASQSSACCCSTPDEGRLTLISQVLVLPAARACSTWSLQALITYARGSAIRTSVPAARSLVRTLPTAQVIPCDTFGMCMLSTRWSQPRLQRFAQSVHSCAGHCHWPIQPRQFRHAFMTTTHAVPSDARKPPCTWRGVPATSLASAKRRTALVYAHELACVNGHVAHGPHACAYATRASAFTKPSLQRRRPTCVCPHATHWRAAVFPA